MTLSKRIAQAGLKWSKQRFYITSAAVGVVLFLVGLMLNGGLLTAMALGFAGGFGLPRWMLSYLKKRRENKFLNAFPDAVDIIVRGVKAGLPLLDCLKMITIDSPEPVKSEFRAIIETQAVGMPLGDACGKLYEQHAGAGGELLRHRRRRSSRRPAAICRKRSAICRACCATARR